MRFAKNFLVVLFALACSLPAAAQAKAGTFTLAHETKWNNVVIPAGEYTISVYSDSHLISSIRDESGKRSIFVVPVAHDYGTRCTNSTVSLEKVGAGWTARSVCFAETGLTLYFAVPSQAGEMVASAGLKSSATGSH